MNHTLFADLSAWLLQVKPLAGSLAVMNVLLLLFARRIVRLVYDEDEHSVSFRRKLSVFRTLNFLILIAVGYFQLYMPAAEKSLGLKLIAILISCYLGYLASHLVNYSMIRRYGKEREIKGERRRVETYNTRLLNIFAQVFIFIMVLITVVQILGFDTLLEAGGIIGFIGVFLALTNSVWAPDIFSGLIILNSDMLQEGDVIELQDGVTLYGMVYKTKVFHTEILDLIHNNRVMLRNARLRDYTIRNFSKFASAKGLRCDLRFKIGYDVPPSEARNMLQTACERCLDEAEISVEPGHGFDIGVQDTGDHAIEWIVQYYTKDIERLPHVQRQLLSIFLETSIAAGISLATPLTHEVTDKTSAFSATEACQNTLTHSADGHAHPGHNRTSRDVSG